MKPPLLLIGHGAHDHTGAAEFGRFVHRMRCRLDQVAADVSGGFVARGRPSLAESVASLVARGHHRLVAVPLALGDSDDISAEIARAKVVHPTLACDRGPTLGASPSILALMAERLADALAEMPRLAAVPAAEEHGEVPWEPVPPAETAVVLVGHGSGDTLANAEVHRVSRLFWETHVPDLLTVETAYVSDAPPSVAQGIERCRRLGAKRVVVLPYLLFAGAVLERIWAEALAYAAGHIDLDVRCAEVIGDCEGLADLVVERYHQILAAAGAEFGTGTAESDTAGRLSDADALLLEAEEEILAAVEPWPGEHPGGRVTSIARRAVLEDAEGELLEAADDHLSLRDLGTLEEAAPVDDTEHVAHVGRPPVRKLSGEGVTMVDGLV